MVIDSFETFISRLKSDKTFTHFALNKTFKVIKVDVEKDTLVVFDNQTLRDREFPLRGIYENNLYVDKELCERPTENGCMECSHREDCKNSKIVPTVEESHDNYTKWIKRNADFGKKKYFNTSLSADKDGNTSVTIDIAKILNEPDLSDNLIGVKSVLERRNIKYLVHFTSYKNVDSIQKYGILSRNELKNRGIKAELTDPNRFDKRPDCISLSISNPNTCMLNIKVKQGLIAEPWIILIDAKILYEDKNAERVLYFTGNAATTSSQYLNQGSTYEDLEKMFAEEYYTKTTDEEMEEAIINKNYEDCTQFKMRYRNFRKKSYETSDVQAEILFPDVVEKKYIIKCMPYSEFNALKNRL